MIVMIVVIVLLIYWLCKAKNDLKRALTEAEVKMFEVSIQVTTSNARCMYVLRSLRSIPNINVSYVTFRKEIPVRLIQNLVCLNKWTFYHMTRSTNSPLAR